MKKRFKFIIPSMLITLVTLILFISMTKKHELVNKTLINIDKLPQEFMDRYFHEMKELNENEENKEKLLIVTSKNKLTNNHGASKVIEAPNNVYFLQYNTIEEKDKALIELPLKDKSLIVEENEIRTINSRVYDSWGIEKTGFNYAIDYVNSKNLNEVIVAVLDTGLDVAAFNAKYPGRLITGYNVLNQSTDVTDNNGHGTHVAGTVADSTPNNVKIVPIKISVGASISSADILTAINYVVYNNKANVMNMSFGGYRYLTSERDSLDAGKNKNIISVAAAGNDNTINEHYPSGYNNVISIASVEQNLVRSYFSNYGNKIDFTAPGSNIKSLNGVVMSGTSMASPHAAGAVAILKSFNKNLTLDDTITLLKSQAVDLGQSGKDIYYGNGLIQFKNNNFCNNADCDRYNIFKKNYDQLPTTKIELNEVVYSYYNYDSENDILETTLKIYKNDNTVQIKKLEELDDVEITGYNEALANNTITVKYDGCIVTFNIVNDKNNKLSLWSPEPLNQTDFAITPLNVVPIPKILYLPNTIEGYKVTKLNYLDKTGRANTEKLIISSNITEIGEESFIGAKKLRNVISLSPGLNIGARAFKGLTTLEKVEGKIKTLGDETFMNAVSLYHVDLDDSMTKIPINSFNGCSQLINIKLPNSLRSILAGAFYKADLRELVIPDTVRLISDNAFGDNYNLFKLTLDNGLMGIGEKAFSFNKINDLHIPANVMNISNAFYGSNSLTNITVDPNNAYMRSPDNCNCITKGNTLILGSANTIIPSKITTIGEKAFYYNKTLKNILIPETVTTIKIDAFEGASNLSIIIPKTVLTIDGFISGVKEKYLYKDSPIYNYAMSKINTPENSYGLYDFKTVEPVRVASAYNGTHYKQALTTLDPYYRKIDVYFEDCVRNEILTRKETIQNANITYENNQDSFKYGDKTFTLSGKTELGIDVSIVENVYVARINPTYSIPTNLIGSIGKQLKDIKLPTGFTWNDENIVLNKIGIQTYYAKFTPEDPINYETVYYLNIKIDVIEGKGIIDANKIIIPNKAFDNTTNVNLDTIELSGIDKSNYQIVSAQISRANIGVQNATVTIKLTEQGKQNYILQNGLDEQSFVVQMTIERVRVNIPTTVDKVYKYNKNVQSLEFNNLDTNIVNVSNNKFTNAGSYRVTISLKNDGNMWSDGTTGTKEYIFTIEKAIYTDELNFEFLDKNVKYDGTEKFLKLVLIAPQNAIFKYMASDGNYILNNPPVYTEVGVYNINYSITINDNYETIYRTETLNIYEEETLTSNGYTGYYDGLEHTITFNVDVSNYNMKYSLDTKYNLTEIPKFTEPGEYNINYKAIINNKEVIGSNKVKIYGIKLSGNDYKIIDNILVINTNDFSNLKNKVNIYAISSRFTHFDKNNAIINDNLIKTGNHVKIMLDEIYTKDYQLSLLGDINSDGYITSADYIKIRKHIMGTEIINGSLYFYASDVNKDNMITSADYVRIRRYIMNGGTL